MLVLQRTLNGPGALTCTYRTPFGGRWQPERGVQCESVPFPETFDEAPVSDPFGLAVIMKQAPVNTASPRRRKKFPSDTPLAPNNRFCGDAFLPTTKPAVPRIIGSPCPWRTCGRLNQRHGVARLTLGSVIVPAGRACSSAMASYVDPSPQTGAAPCTRVGTQRGHRLR